MGRGDLIEYVCCPQKKRKFGDRQVEVEDDEKIRGEKTSVYQLWRETSEEPNPADSLLSRLLAFSV